MKDKKKETEVEVDIFDEFFEMCKEDENVEVIVPESDKTEEEENNDIQS